MNLAAIMDALADQAATVTGLTYQYAYPAESISAPCVVVGYPSSVEFDTTFGRGSDTLTFPVWLVVGKTDAQASRDVLSGLLDGVAGFKAQMDGSLGDVVSSARVESFTVEEIAFGTVAYIAARFDVEVIT